MISKPQLRRLAAHPSVMMLAIVAAALVAIVSMSAIASAAGPISASIASTLPPTLTEANLHGATVTVDITDGTFDAGGVVAGDFSVDGPTGTSVSSAVRDNADTATLTLAFDGTDFDLDTTLSVTVEDSALDSGSGPAGALVRGDVM